MERLRYSRPHVPLDDRRCRFCPPPGAASTNPPVDDEIHAIMNCELMKDDRSELFNKVLKLYQHFLALKQLEKFNFLMCPTSATLTKHILFHKGYF